MPLLCYLPDSLSILLLCRHKIDFNIQEESQNDSLKPNLDIEKEMHPAVLDAVIKRWRVIED